MLLSDWLAERLKDEGFARAYAASERRYQRMRKRVLRKIARTEKRAARRAKEAKARHDEILLGDECVEQEVG